MLYKPNLHKFKVCIRHSIKHETLTLTSRKSFQKMWLKFNGNFCIIHRFRVVTYGNKIQNTLWNSSGRFNRAKGGDTIGQHGTLQQLQFK